MAIFKVMLVDDEPDIRKIARLCLESLGRWEVLLAGTAQEALVMAARERPDIILLDVQLPDMDGPKLLGELRKQPECAHTPVVFLTAQRHQQQTDRLLALDVEGIISKPFDPMRLAGDVQRLFDSRQVR